MFCAAIEARLSVTVNIEMVAVMVRMMFFSAVE